MVVAVIVVLVDMVVDMMAVVDMVVNIVLYMMVCSKWLQAEKCSQVNATKGMHRVNATNLLQHSYSNLWN